MIEKLSRLLESEGKKWFQKFCVWKTKSGEWSGAIVQALIRKCSMVTSTFHHSVDTLTEINFRVQFNYSTCFLISFLFYSRRITP